MVERLVDISAYFKIGYDYYKVLNNYVKDCMIKEKFDFLQKQSFVIVLFGHFSDLENVCKRESGGVYHVADSKNI